MTEPARVLLISEAGGEERFSQAGVDVVIAAPARLAELSDAEIAGFAGVFVPDDRGALVSLADNADAGRVLGILHERNAPIAAVGHGPAFLLAAPPNSEGQWLFDGYRLTSCVDDGLPTALKAAGAVFDETQDVVVDRNLVTARHADPVGAVLELMTRGIDESVEKGRVAGHRP